MIGDEFTVRELYGTHIAGYDGLRCYQITNDYSPSLMLDENSIICFSESNAHAICELINQSNNGPVITHPSSQELVEVLDCLNHSQKGLDNDVVKTVIKEVYSTKREDLHK